MSALTDREYRAIARVLAEVAAQPNVDVRIMEKVIRHIVYIMMNEEPLIFCSGRFRDRILRKLTELQTRQAPAQVPEGVSPHTKVVSWD